MTNQVFSYSLFPLTSNSVVQLASVQWINCEISHTWIYYDYKGRKFITLHQQLLHCTIVEWYSPSLSIILFSANTLATLSSWLLSKTLNLPNQPPYYTFFGILEAFFNDIILCTRKPWTKSDIRYKRNNLMIDCLCNYTPQCVCLSLWAASMEGLVDEASLSSCTSIPLHYHLIFHYYYNAIKSARVPMQEWKLMFYY